MLREITPVKQHKDDFRRRWFEDEFFDLIVWYDEHQGIVGFQLCYDKSGNEHALTFLEERGYSHHRIDAGGKSVWETKAPVLTAGGAFPQQRVVESFVAGSKAIDSSVADYVVQKIKEHASSAGAA